MTARPCAEIRPLLSEHLEGELAAGLDASVRAHLAECAECRARVDLLRRTVGALREIPDLPAPAGILSGVRQRLRPVPWHRRLNGGRPWLLGVPVGAVATALVVVGVALFQARFPDLPRTAGDAPGTPAPATPQAPPRPAAPSAVGTLPAAPRFPPPAPGASAPARRVGERPSQPPAPRPAAETASPPEPEVSLPPTHFVIPEPEAGRPPTGVPRVARRPERPAGPGGEDFTRVGGREAGSPEVLLPEREESGGGPPRRDIAAQPRGADLPSRDSRLARESARRHAAFEGGPGVSEIGGGPPSKSVSGRRAAPPVERPASLSLVLPPGDGVEVVRRLVLRDGGVVLGSRAVDPGASALARRYRGRGAAPANPRAWELSARVPRHAVPRLLDALERRPGVEILERPTLPAPAGGEAQVELRITVLQ